jgi:hypothetical protein
MCGGPLDVLLQPRREGGEFGIGYEVFRIAVGAVWFQYRFDYLEY